MKKFLKISFIIFTLILLVFAIIFSIILHNVIESSKEIKFDKNLLISLTSKIEMYSNNDNLILETANNNLVDYSSLPKHVKNAFISIEDKNFYSHSGLNYKRILKSVLTNLRYGYPKQGGSTISQQLIKNTHLNNEKTLKRKIKEIVLTKKLEKNFSKDEILETYLNVIYFGNNSYGIEEASKNYFNKSATELSVAEAATLAGLIKAPTKYSPILNYENCLERRNLVLSQMKKDGYLSNEEFNKSVNEEIKLNSSHKKTKNFYEQAVLEEAQQLLNLTPQQMKLLGVKIYTYLDEKLQNDVIKIANNDKFYHKNKFGNTPDSAICVIDNNTGGINAFYGKCDYNLMHLKRQPGSTIKPILVYAPALENGIICPETQILDEKINIDGYSPKNVGGTYHGYVSATEAIEKSLNIPAVKLMQKLGVKNCKNFVKKVNLDLSNEGDSYALALGGFKFGTNLVDLTNTFLPFSQHGNFTKARFIKKITCVNGLLYSNRCEKTQVMSDESAYLMTKMLVSGVKNGTSKRLNGLNFDIAGKTGTVGIKGTNLNTDAYSCAYSQNKTYGVWLGNTTNKTEFNLEGSNNGGTYATNMLKSVILCQENTKHFDQKPSGIEKINIDEVALTDEHKICLACENTPPMFQKQIEVNKKFNNFKVSSSYSNPEPTKISVEVKANKPCVSFIAKRHLIYKIFRIEEDQTTCLETIKNKSGEVSFVDNSAIQDTFYDYYVECYAYNYTKFLQSNKAKSEVKKVIIL